MNLQCIGSMMTWNFQSRYISGLSESQVKFYITGPLCFEIFINQPRRVPSHPYKLFMTLLTIRLVQLSETKEIICSSPWNMFSWGNEGIWSFMGILDCEGVTSWDPRNPNSTSFEHDTFWRWFRNSMGHIPDFDLSYVWIIKGCSLWDGWLCYEECSQFFLSLLWDCWQIN